MVSFVIITPTYNGINAGLEKLLISIKSQSGQPEKYICYQNTAMVVGMVLFTMLNYLSQRFIVLNRGNNGK